ncbi:Unknown protein [Striga hermonthica]|uniref:Uncharacterized protein n=1 Tax=Striga hermonthica TaxID=68872 RepID=A0A9N7R1D2_STRHE|nr:Unknown protein [Striga hermonthica]
MSGVDGSQILRVVAAVGASVIGGSFTLGLVISSISERVTFYKKKKHGKPCWACKAVGYYACKLCRGNGTLKWSPLFDPVYINPCVCPTCDGFKVQRCLNCLACGFT